MVDRQTGLVAVFSLYHSHSKGGCAQTRRYGRVCAGSGAAAGDLDLVELFRIRGGRIHEMESVWTVIPLGAGAGW